ncbi:hypothetical protein [Lentzea aerocolonigenes]|uniref:hypothetical protein n=1 Tax=Lentzea aerocolonigenes TaxID=68170 RepID=UPI0004C44D1B|nr:hypothetical protein [Lentzea aerocolonigenes]MCP2249353.1 hypothetical protein [Lentzea aerocolonigenes]
MSKFEDNLWAELQQEHGQTLLRNMTRRQSRRTKRWIVAAAAVTVLGTGALAASAYFGGAPPAYAVVDNPDGSVTLTIRELERFDEATAKLRERGVPAIAVGLRQDCVETGRSLDVPVAAVDFEFTKEASKITITPGRIPVDATVVLATANEGDHWIVTGGVYARDQLPGCLPKRVR